MNRVRTAALAGVLALLAAASIAAQDRAAGPPYAGRPLVDVLQDLNRRGLRIVFSTSLVRPALRVGGEPAGPTPREVLDQVLRPHGLQARPGPQGVLIVARAPRARETGASTTAAAGTLRGRVVDADTDQPLADALVVLQRPERRVTTDGEGRFEMAGIEPGRQSLFVSLVGYPLARAAGRGRRRLHRAVDRARRRPVHPVGGPDPVCRSQLRAPRAQRRAGRRSVPCAAGPAQRRHRR
jgi:hypothetical protein